MISDAMVVSKQERVPHRWHVLEILRSMRLGHPLIRLSSTSYFTHLEGAPLAVHFFNYLERNGYIAPQVKEGLLSHYYTLTADGLDLYEGGERWWRSLVWHEKLWVRVYG